MTRTCAFCGDEFSTESARKRFCSQRCQIKGWHEGTRAPYTCIDCGGVFLRKRTTKNKDRPRCRKCATGRATRGANNVNYNGGLCFDRAVGRWRIVCRDHSTVFYYRAVMEAHLGRELLPGEHVHHINGDPTDDRIENLELLDSRAHGALHGSENWAARKARWEHKWAEHHPCCIDCGTTERPHAGRGLCSRCYGRVRSRERRQKERAAA